MQKKTSLLIGICVFLLVVAIAIGAYVLLTTQTKPVAASQSDNTFSQSNVYKVLKPATLKPKIAECSQPLTYASDGNPSPVQCSNGALNVLAWNALSAIEPSVMRLGYSPTVAQVEADMCADANAANADSSAAISAPLEATAYQLSALYYGWNLNINPSAVLAAC